MATIEGHPDFRVLERRLIELVGAVKSGDRSGPFAPVAIVAPTGRLLGHLRQVLAASLPSLLNLHFLHHDALLREVAAGAEIALPRPLADHARQALLARLDGGDFVARLLHRRALIEAVAQLRTAVDSVLKDLGEVTDITWTEEAP